MRRVVPKHVNLEQNDHALMECHAQTTFATKNLIPVKIPLVIALHQMIHVLQINALNLLVGVNSVVVLFWKLGRTLVDIQSPI
jgi:hypothetical protein